MKKKKKTKTKIGFWLTPPLICLHSLWMIPYYKKQLQEKLPKNDSGSLSQMLSSIIGHNQIGN